MILDIPGTVKEYLQDKGKEQRPRKLGQYYPSEVPKCLREWWLSFLSPGKYDEERQGIFEAGEWVEEWLAKVLKWAVENHQIEVVWAQRHITCVVGEPQERVALNGKADFLLLLKNKVTQETQLIECKSASSVYYINEAKKDHVIQIMPYIWSLDPTYACVVYIDKKNFSHVKAFEVKYNPILMEWIIARIRKQHARIKNMELPIAEALYCPNCMQEKLKIEKDGRTKIGVCPKCTWKGNLQSDTNLWRLSYCPFRGTGKCCADEQDGAKLVVPELEVAKEAGEGPE